MKIMG